MKRKSLIPTTWSPGFAYLVGLIASDGNLSSDQRHITVTSKDEDLLLSVKEYFRITSKIGKKSRGGNTEKKYSVLTIGDRNFYDFLLKIGLTPNKSKTIRQLDVPEEFFIHFLRGCIDGDGSITTSFHPESKQIQLRLRLASASRPFLEWIHKCVLKTAKVTGGWIYVSPDKQMSTLAYGKKDSIKILNQLYLQAEGLYLKRKYSIAKPFILKT